MAGVAVGHARPVPSGLSSLGAALVSLAASLFVLIEALSARRWSPAARTVSAVLIYLAIVATGCDTAARRAAGDTGRQTPTSTCETPPARSRGPASVRERLMTSCRRARGRAAASLSIGIGDRRRELAILRAMVLGYRSDLDRETREVFALCGALHIFAISGLHVGIVSLLIIFVLSACGVSRVRWALYLVPLLGLYVCATGARASAVRAWVMATVYFSAPLLRRRSDAFTALAIAALIILLWDPRQLFDVGFVYSFTVVLALLICHPEIEYRLRCLWRKDPLRLQPESWRVGALRGLAGCLANWTALSVVAWLASTPLTAYYFERLIPAALPGNVLVIPAAFLIAVSGFSSLALGPCLDLPAEIFNHAAAAVIFALVGVMDWLGSIPLLCIRVPRPPVWAVWVWYAMFGLVFLNMMDRRKRE